MVLFGWLEPTSTEWFIIMNVQLPIILYSINRLSPFPRGFLHVCMSINMFIVNIHIYDSHLRIRIPIVTIPRLTNLFEWKMCAIRIEMCEMKLITMYTWCIWYNVLLIRRGVYMVSVSNIHYIINWLAISAVWFDHNSRYACHSYLLWESFMHK